MAEDRSNKIKVVKDGIDVFLRAGDTDAGKALSEIREEYETKIKEKFWTVPTKLKARLDSVNDAFLQLSQVKQVLKLAHHDEREHQYAADQGRRLMAARQYMEAQRYFEHAMALGGENAELLLLAGTAAVYAQSFAEAAYYADQLLERDPKDFQALTLKGLVNLALGQNQSALTFFSRAYQLKPQSTIIKKYIEKAQSKTMTSGAKSAAVRSFKRRWTRKNVKKVLLVHDSSDVSIQNFKMVSLSGGGCLVEGTELPPEFQFNFQLNDGTLVYGIGQITYVLPSGQTGVKFSNLTPIDQDLINQEILRQAS